MTRAAHSVSGIITETSNTALQACSDM
jgi:hypothetical protein